jgi:hypothetical protein
VVAAQSIMKRYSGAYYALNRGGSQMTVRFLPFASLSAQLDLAG